MPKPGSEPKPSLEEFRSRWVSLEELGQQLSWARADLACEAVATLGKGVIKDFAEVIGTTTSYVRDLASTANRFPKSEDRLAAPPITFSHFKIAARTEEPRTWIYLAVQHDWNTRELSEAIQDAKDPMDQAQRYLRDKERLVQEVRKFNERWPEAGEEAALEWRERKAQENTVA